MLPVSLRESYIVVEEISAEGGTLLRVTIEVGTGLGCVVLLILLNIQTIQQVYYELLIVKIVTNPKLYLMERLKTYQDHFHTSIRNYFFVSVSILSTYRHYMAADFVAGTSAVSLDFLPYFYIVYAFIFYLYFAMCCVLIDRHTTPKDAYEPREDQKEGSASSTLSQFDPRGINLTQKFKPLSLFIIVSLVAAFSLACSFFFETTRSHSGIFLMVFLLVVFLNTFIELCRYLIYHSKVYRTLTKIISLHILQWGLVYPFLIFPLIGYIEVGGQ